MRTSEGYALAATPATRSILAAAPHDTALIMSPFEGRYHAFPRFPTLSLRSGAQIAVRSLSTTFRAQFSETAAFGLVRIFFIYSRSSHRRCRVTLFLCVSYLYLRYDEDAANVRARFHAWEIRRSY